MEMAGAGEAQRADNSSGNTPHAAAARRAPAVVDLILRPERFFLERSPLAGGTLLLAIAVSGIGNAADGMDGMAGQVAKTWGLYWAIVAGLAVLVTPMRWFVGRWWLGKRLQWSGAGVVVGGDAQVVRQIFIWSELVFAVPTLVFTLACMMFHSSPLVESPLAISLLFAFVWSEIVIYRASRAMFTLSPWRARLWLLGFPIAVTAVLALRSAWPLLRQ